MRVATLKHAHHNLRLDDDTTDSGRHRLAGAKQVAVVSSQRWAIITENAEEDELDFNAALKKLDACDLVIVEGYKKQPIPKIEVRRQQAASQESLAVKDPHVIAIATDSVSTNAPGSLPEFQLDDVASVADFITDTLRLGAK